MPNEKVTAHQLACLTFAVAAAAAAAAVAAAVAAAPIAAAAAAAAARKTNFVAGQPKIPTNMTSW